ncbi:sensor histidine kinase [Nocardiopsis sp. NPDC006938]|uniref:sensor histidine kinase n=1 Tax=Nocardiopsis sp. NPDC006938 TaxID=3364337 RepID=UPI00367D2468
MDTPEPPRAPHTWLLPALTVGGAAALAASTVGLGGGTAVLSLMTAVAALATGLTVWTALRSRRERREHERRLALWAGERAVQRERLRIAHDLHDLVSHGLGTVTVRAAAAARAQGPSGDRERIGALADIEEVSRRTTTELRRMLTVLRSSGPGASVRPAETLDALPGIVRGARERGLDVALEVTPDPPGVVDTVSPGVQLTVCSVVREALDNCARHAGPTGARVAVRRGDRSVTVTVVDDGPARGWVPSPGAGFGLVGLRERVRALDGTLSARPKGTGFVVTARLPDPETA